jgi:DNA primase
VSSEVLELFRRNLPGRLRQGAGGNYLTTCPFHKDGHEGTPSFSVNAEKGVWHCFTGGCPSGGGGGIGKMLEMLGKPRSAVEAELAVVRPVLEQAERIGKSRILNFNAANPDPFAADFVLPEACLGVYLRRPEALLARGFDEGVLFRAGVGVDPESGRTTYPVRDVHGALAGVVGGAAGPHHEPKYLVYGRKEFGEWVGELYPVYECKKGRFLWNLSPGGVGYKSIIVVEGYKACLWLVQNGFPNTVALMGSAISEEQQRLLHRTGASVVLFLDNDRAGRGATLRVGELLWAPMYGKVTVAQYPARCAGGEQPDDLGPGDVARALSGAVQYTQHLRSEVEKGVLPWVR